MWKDNKIKDDENGIQWLNAKGLHIMPLFFKKIKTLQGTFHYKFGKQSHLKNIIFSNYYRRLQ